MADKFKCFKKLTQLSCFRVAWQNRQIWPKDQILIGQLTNGEVARRIERDMGSTLLWGVLIAYIVRAVNEKNREARVIIEKPASMTASKIFAYLL